MSWCFEFAWLRAAMTLVEVVVQFLNQHLVLPAPLAGDEVVLLCDWLLLELLLAGDEVALLCDWLLLGLLLAGGEVTLPCDWLLLGLLLAGGEVTLPCDWLLLGLLLAGWRLLTGGGVATECVSVSSAFPSAVVVAEEALRPVLVFAFACMAASGCVLRPARVDDVRKVAEEPPPTTLAVAECGLALGAPHPSPPSLPADVGVTVVVGATTPAQDRCEGLA